MDVHSETENENLNFLSWQRRIVVHDHTFRCSMAECRALHLDLRCGCQTITDRFRSRGGGEQTAGHDVSGPFGYDLTAQKLLFHLNVLSLEMSFPNASQGLQHWDQAHRRLPGQG